MLELEDSSGENASSSGGTEACSMDGLLCSSSDWLRASRGFPDPHVHQLVMDVRSGKSSSVKPTLDFMISDCVAFFEEN